MLESCTHCAFGNYTTAVYSVGITILLVPLYMTCLQAQKECHHFTTLHTDVLIATNGHHSQPAQSTYTLYSHSE